MDITQLKAQYKAGERNFSGAQLSGVNLVWVELTGVNFQGADLTHANLSGANLSESNFSGETNLTFADLSRADFRNTNLKGTRLEGANLEGIQLEGAVYDETTKFPLGFDPVRAGAIAAHQEFASGTLQQVAVISEPAQPEVNLEQYTTRERPKLREKDTKPPKLRERDTKPKYLPPRIFSPKPAADTTKELFQKARSATVEAISDWQEAKQSNWASVHPPQTVSAQEISALNTSGQGKSSIVPTSIKGSWNWGAFLLPWVWFLPNRLSGGLWLWLLMWIPGWGNWITLGFAIAMATNGNTWAWQSRKWESIKAFKNHQRAWAIAGIIFWGLMWIISVTSSK